MGNKINNLWQAICKHKYLWTIVLFILIAGFLDENSILKFYQLRSHNNELKAEIRQYEHQYDSCSTELQRLKASSRAYEEVARVRLLMKSEDEDVYVIETQE